MRTTLSFIAILLLLNIVKAQTTAIPDPNFEQALITFGYDTGVPDGSVPTANINTVTALGVISSNISDLTGIEDFTALTVLYCYGNVLTSLNVTQNTALTSLQCHDNLLTSLDVSQNVNLTDLLCYNNQITNLDVTQNLALSNFQCGTNLLTSLNVTQNTGLTILDCTDNQLTSIDVTQNTSLLEFYCQDNLLTSINVTLNTALTNFACFNNQITSLTIAQNPDLVEFGCHYNQLTCLNAKNGNNINLPIFWSLGNPNLICIEVDNVTWSTTNWTDIDVTSSFSTNCSNPCAVGVNEYEIKQVSLYPNPTTGLFNIDAQYKDAIVEIYDVVGKKILTEENINSKITIDITDQPNGIYFIKVLIKDKVISQKIIKD